jgi:hypothetical protein
VAVAAGVGRRPAGDDAELEPVAALADGGGLGVDLAGGPARHEPGEIRQRRGDGVGEAADHVDDLVGELGDALGPPVPVHAVLVAAVHHGLEEQIRQGPDVVGDGRAGPAQRGDRPQAGGRVADPGQGEPEDRLPVVLGGHQRPRRGQAREQHHAELLGA